jgi:flagellar hook protein FlgE
VNIVFVRHGGGRWEVHAVSERDVAGVPADLGRMDLVFNASGALTSVTGGPLLSPRKHDNAERWTLAFDASRTVSYRADSEIYGFEQDGRSPGDLLELTLSARGELTAEYSNDMTVSAAWVLDGIEGWIASPE